MTVCIAAMTEHNSVLGVSDRMLTAGDIEFEPGQSKIWPLSTSIAVLVAGESTLQAEILRDVELNVTEWIAAKPKTWVSVKEAVAVYCKKYKSLLREHAESEILYPLGLDLQSFFSRQSTMNAELVRDIADKLHTYSFSEQLETIFLGIDNDGPLVNAQLANYAHIYVTRDGESACYDTAGFAAIGIGKSHAESQFMFSRHWRAKPFHETILLAYSAKKRAEAAPGVGKDTDAIVIGPALGSLVWVEQKYISQLDGIYQRSQKSAARVAVRAQKAAKDFVEQVRQDYAQKTQTAQTAAAPKMEDKARPSGAQKSEPGQ